MKNGKKVRKLLYIFIICIFLLTLIWYLYISATKSKRMKSEQNYLKNITYQDPVRQEDLKNNLDLLTMGEGEIQKDEKWLKIAEERRTFDNVFMEMKTDTLTPSSVTVIITDNNELPYEYNGAYRIDIKKNEKWKEVKKKFRLPKITDTISHGYVYYKIGEDKKVEIKIDWEERYGRLKKGKYRLVKFVGNKEIYTEFIIE